MLPFRRARRHGRFHRLLAGLDGGRIARDVTDQPVLMGSVDQRRVDAARQLAARKHLSRALPAAQPAQLLVRRQPLDQFVVGMPITALATNARANAARSLGGQPPHVHQRLDRRQFQRHDDPLVQICERPEFLPEPGEKIVLNVVLGA
jgi:hypothetical protein